MKLNICCTAILMINLTLFASSRISGQSISNTTLTLNIDHGSLSTALQQLQKRTGYSIFYPTSKVNKFKNVVLDGKARTIAETLDLLLKGTGLYYRQQGNVIIISDKDTATANAVNGETSAIADKRIIGMVVDEKGDPLPGVTVRSKNDKSISTATDVNGHFHIDLTNESDILVFSYIGFVSREIPAYGVTSLKVVLSADATRLNEVVVIGYGTAIRKELTGAVASVNAKTISEQPVGNVLNALQGRMSGVQVNQSNGLPGSSVSITIRGRNSLNSGNLPLYIVDGVPYTFYNSNAIPATDNLNAFGTSGANGGVSPFNSINPDDIESISVLKDADATAIYGARGANGVILITTKKGKTGTTVTNVNVSSGIGKVNHFIDMLSGPEYLALRKEAFANDKVTPTGTNAPDLTTWSQTDFTDWQRALIGGTAHYTDAQVSLSGGADNTHFTFSSGYHRETTVYPGENSENRFSGRLNLEHTSTNKKLYALFSATYSNDATNLPSTDLSSLYNLPPNYPAYKPDGTLNYFSGVTNPYAYLLQPYKGTTTNLNTNATLRYTLLPGLTIKANLGYAVIDLNQAKQLPASSKNNATATQVSTANFADNYSKSYIIEPQVEYVRNIYKGKLDALLGITQQQNEAQGYSSTGTGYSNDNLLGVLSAASTQSTSNSYDLYRYNSIFGRLNYNWDGKYVINGTIRRDGSSRFGSNNKFGTFGAVGAAWIFSEEKAIKDNLAFLSYGKLRSSYGVTGNDQILNYQYLSTYATGGSTLAYQGTSIQYPARLANPDIKWERTKKFEAAVDLGFIKDRILISAAYYRNLSDNQLIYIPTGGQVGFSSYLGNFDATVENKGVELELNTQNIKGKNFSWSSSFNFTMPKTTLVKFNDLASISTYSNQYIVGQSPSVTKLYVYNGIDPSTGKILYVTKSGGLPVFGVDQIPGERGSPFYGGLNNSFTYKQFELGFFIQFSHQNGYTNSVGTTLGSMVNQNASTTDHWRQAGDATLFPAASTSASSAVYSSYGFYYNSSSAFYGDASWIKLKNVNLSYSLPKNIIQRVKMNNVRLYAQAQNVWFAAKSKYVYDPETGTAMPALRVIVIGLNASF